MFFCLIFGKLGLQSNAKFQICAVLQLQNTKHEQQNSVQIFSMVTSQALKTNTEIKKSFSFQKKEIKITFSNSNIELFQQFLPVDQDQHMLLRYQNFGFNVLTESK